MMAGAGPSVGGGGGGGGGSSTAAMSSSSSVAAAAASAAAERFELSSHRMRWHHAERGDVLARRRAANADGVAAAVLCPPPSASAAGAPPLEARASMDADEGAGVVVVGWSEAPAADEGGLALAALAVRRLVRATVGAWLAAKRVAPATALVAAQYLWRYFLRRPAWPALLHPGAEELAVGAVLLAAKAEEDPGHPRAAALLAAAGVPGDGAAVARCCSAELDVMDALDFDLWVWHPLPSLDGFLHALYQQFPAADGAPAASAERPWTAADLPPLPALRQEAISACFDICASDACVLFSPAQLALHAVTRVIPNSDLRTQFVNAVVFTALDDGAKSAFLRAMSGLREVFNELQRAVLPDDEAALARARAALAERELTLSSVFDPEVFSSYACESAKRRRVEEAAGVAEQLEDEFLTATG